MKRQITQMASDLQKLKASETMEIANKKVPAFVLHLSHHLIFIYIRVHSAIEALENQATANYFNLYCIAS